MGCDQHFSLKYFLKFAFVREISAKRSDGFGRYGHDRVKQSSAATVTIEL